MKQRIHIRVAGRVQGIGFRPTIYRHAVAAGISGRVANTADGVMIEAEGEASAVAAFLDQVRNAPPPLAVIDAVAVTQSPPMGDTAFRIVASERSGDLAAGITPDIATCRACAADIRNPADRRFHYPFTTCTSCGPRFTIMEALPYDRERTSMGKFHMCGTCEAEYALPPDRRFDSQTNACARCGPRLTLLDSAGRHADIGDPLATTADLLKRGVIVAIKGLGGYHIACDAKNADAIALLRARKRRPAKALAIMFATIEGIGRECAIGSAEIAMLGSAQAPIVVVRRRPDSRLPAILAPDTDTLGVFLPYTPLHHLLLDLVGPLVMTSGNRADEPIVSDEAGLSRILGAVADYALVHDRPIRRRCDDSVVEIAPTGPIFIRRSRGWVPDPVTVPISGPPVLAVGADMKNTFAVTRGREVFFSQHIGDLEELSTLEFHALATEDLVRLLGVKPVRVAHDLHPGCHSARAARARWAAMCAGVQHHHAHVAACMAENGREKPVIGVALDGTGYGPDGTVWGGEFLVADFGGYERVGHFKHYRLPGGDAAITHPARMAASCLIAECGDDDVLLRRALPHLDDAERVALRRVVDHGLNAPWTSSAGRLFDAVAALCGDDTPVSYEGQAAIRLQAAAEWWRGTTAPFEGEIDTGRAPFVVSFGPAIRQIVEKRACGVAVAELAARFHATVAAQVTEACNHVRKQRAIGTVALSGGVFQNRLLLEALVALLRGEGFEVLFHTRVPPNDAGIALGQAVIAMAAGSH